MSGSRRRGEWFWPCDRPLMSHLGRELQRQTGLSDADYAVLVELSEAPGERSTTPVSSGSRLGWEKSRLSKQIQSNVDPWPGRPRGMLCRRTRRVLPSWRSPAGKGSTSPPPTDRHLRHRPDPLPDRFRRSPTPWSPRSVAPFNEFEGSAYIDAENPSASTTQLTITAASVDTRNADRDAHLRGNDFFDMETYPEISFASTEDIEAVAEGYRSPAT